jgi:hypothetical protein
MADIHWTNPLELLVKKEAERSLALRWAHDESQRWCASWNTRLTFPSILLATIGGAGSIGAQSLFPFDGSSTLIGIISLTVGFLQTIQNYLKFASRAESHRISSLAYGKIHSHLSLQLSLPRSERQVASDTILYITTESERLAEIVPQIPLAIKDKFHKRFGNSETAIPTILNGLEAVSITTHITAESPSLRPVVRVEV